MLSRARTIWIACQALMAVCALRVFDIVLLKRYLDAPLVVLVWVAAPLALLLIARSAARAIEPAERSFLQRRVAGLDAPAIALIAFGLLLLFGQHWGYQRAASDGREYFVQLRSLYFDGDLDFANEESFGIRGTAAIYPFGAPLLWLPFYAAGDAWLAVLNLLGADYPRDGYFNAYQRAVGLGSLFYGWVGLLLLTRLTTAWVGRGLAAAATIVTVAGSFLAWYFVVDPSLPHVVSMAAVALYVWLWHRSGRGRVRRGWALLGAAAGLMSLVRWQNVGFGLLAFVDWTGRLVVALRAGNRRAALQVVTDGLAFAAAFLVVFSPQLAFWRVTRGGWLDAPTGEHAVSWTGPLRDVLFTPDHGLFTSSPLLALAMLGFLLLLPRAPRVAGLLLVAFAFQVYVLGTVGSPGYGFGTRRLASCAVLFVPGLALFVDTARRRPLAVPAGLLAVLIGFNLLFMLDVRQGRLPPTGPVRGIEILDSAFTRTGNPLSLPMNVWFAWRHDTDLGHYERLGTQTFTNLRIDIGTEGDRRFLAGGWGKPESDGSRPFRWSLGDESLLLAPLRQRAPYTLRIEAQPFRRPDSAPQTLTIELNGAVVAELSMQPGIRTYEVTFEPAQLHAGVNGLRFRYGYATSPRDLGLSDDPRPLAVRFLRVELLRGE